VGWPLGYTSAWQGSRYDDAGGGVDPDTRSKRLREGEADAVKWEDVPAFVKRIEKICHERPDILLVNAISMVDMREK
jgi:hypothetical protein